MAKTYNDTKAFEQFDLIPDENLYSEYLKIKDYFSKRQKQYQEKLEEAANTAQANLDKINLLNN